MIPTSNSPIRVTSGLPGTAIAISAQAGTHSLDWRMADREASAETGRAPDTPDFLTLLAMPIEQVPARPDVAHGEEPAASEIQDKPSGDHLLPAPERGAIPREARVEAGASTAGTGLPQPGKILPLDGHLATEHGPHRGGIEQARTGAEAAPDLRSPGAIAHSGTFRDAPSGSEDTRSPSASQGPAPDPHAAAPKHVATVPMPARPIAAVQGPASAASPRPTPDEGNAPVLPTALEIEQDLLPRTRTKPLLRAAVRSSAPDQRALPAQTPIPTPPRAPALDETIQPRRIRETSPILPRVMDRGSVESSDTMLARPVDHEANATAAPAPHPAASAAPVLPVSTGQAGILATAPIDPSGLAKLASQIEHAIAQTDEARELARASRPELVLRTREFGAVTMRVENVGSDLRATLAARDPAFVPAAQAAIQAALGGAIAERAAIHTAEVPPPLTPRSTDLGANPNTGQNAGNGAGAGNANGSGSDQLYGSSPGSEQRLSQAEPAQTETDEAKPAVRHDRNARGAGIFA